MQIRKLGRSGLEVSALGLGCMGMSANYGVPGELKEMTALLRAAVDRGVTFFDTAEVYGPFTNEQLLGVALGPVRDQVVIATKFGFEVDPVSRERRGFNSQPAHIKASVEASLKRLNTESTDVRNRFARFTPDIMQANQPLLDLLGMGAIRGCCASRQASAICCEFIRTLKDAAQRHASA